MRLFDVKHLGRERVIGCWEVDGVLIDPGPESSLANWIDDLGGPPRALLLTHIHLDHAGGAGALVRRWPELPVYVHERGAPHLVDPSKLLASAGRLYGDEMERLWGEVVPVPESSITALSGGEEVLGLRRRLHARARLPPRQLLPSRQRPRLRRRHRLRSDPPERVRDAADAAARHRHRALAGIAGGDRGLGAQRASGLTHFGEIEDVPGHLATVRERLTQQAERARTMDAEEFERALRDDVERESGPAGDAMLQAVPPEQQCLGLRRYWDKRG